MSLDLAVKVLRIVGWGEVKKGLVTLTSADRELRHRGMVILRSLYSICKGVLGAGIAVYIVSHLVRLIHYWQLRSGITRQFAQSDEADVSTRLEVTNEIHDLAVKDNGQRVQLLLGGKPRKPRHKVSKPFWWEVAHEIQAKLGPCEDSPANRKAAWRVGAQYCTKRNVRSKDVAHWLPWAVAMSFVHRPGAAFADAAEFWYPASPSKKALNKGVSFLTGTLPQ